MNPGYAKPLYILPFDHRHSYLTGMFDLEPPLDRRSSSQAVRDSKRLIYEGFLKAIDDGDVAEGERRHPRRRGVRRRHPRATQSAGAASPPRSRSSESGSDEFEFEYGRRLREAHIEALAIRPSPRCWCATTRTATADMNSAAARRASRHLSDLLPQPTSARFMFELLVPATDAQKQAKPAATTPSTSSRLRPVASWTAGDPRAAERWHRPRRVEDRRHGAARRLRAHRRHGAPRRP